MKTVKAICDCGFHTIHLCLLNENNIACYYCTILHTDVTRTIFKRGSANWREPLEYIYIYIHI